MEVEEQPKLRFVGVDIVNIDFQSERRLDQEAEVDMDVRPKVFYPEDNQQFFKIVIELSLVAKDYFKLNLLAFGNFQFSKEVEDEIRRQFVNVNAPAIMFPYLRSFVSTFTSNLGNVTGNIVMPPQFFDGELEELQNNVKEGPSMEN